MVHELLEKHRRDHFLSFWSFYGHGFKKALGKSWEKYNQALAIAVIIYLLVAILLPMWAWLSDWLKTNHPKFDISLWIQIIIPVILLFLFLGYHLAGAPYEIYKEIYGKYEIEIEKNAPKFKLSCDKNVEGRALLTGNGQIGFIGFFRMRVETECVKGIKNCLGHLFEIEKDGEIIFRHESLELPFAKAEEPDSLAKRIAPNDPKWLDILAVYLHQPRAMSEVEVLVRAHNPHALPKEDERDIVTIATRQHSQALDINGNYIFKKIGEYILHVNVVGDDAPTAKAQLKFNWTGYAKTSTIEIKE